MTAAIVGVDDPSALERAAIALRSGGAVVLPTETVYGLAALPHAIDVVFALKGRPESVPVAVLVDSTAQARTVALLSTPALRLADRFWPGPLTMVVPRRPDVDLTLGGNDATVGVRCPDHDFVRALARLVGPLATTSANRHGEPTPPTATDAAGSLTGNVALVIDGGTLHGTPSTVVDLTGDEAMVLREGAIRARDLAG